MEKEVQDHKDRDHWETSPKKDVPLGTRILQSVWAFKCKQYIDTREVYKHKARLNAHRGQQTHGVKLVGHLSPVVYWTSIRFFLIISLLTSGWHTQQIDFVLAFPQVKVECDIFMELPNGFNFKLDFTKDIHCLKLLQNLYGTKQGAKVWYDHLHTTGLMKLGYKRSKVDKCVFYNGKMVFLVYTDDGIFIGPDLEEINLLKEELHTKGEFQIEDMGTIDEYLEVKVKHLPDSTIELAQPHMVIAKIQEDLSFQPNMTSKEPGDILSGTVIGSTPTTDESRLRLQINHRRVELPGEIYMPRASSFTVLHQCTRFSSNLRMSHAKAI
jgi:hypothetical protein